MRSPSGGNVEAVALVLRLEPARADPEHGAAPGDDVERRDDLREQRRIPVGVARDERREPHVRVRAASAPSSVYASSM